MLFTDACILLQILSESIGIVNVLNINERAIELRTWSCEAA